MAGTIIEDHGEIAAAFAEALRKNEIAFTEDEIKVRMGASKREVIGYFVDKQGRHGSPRDEKVEATYASFRNELEKLYSENLVPIAGAATTFDWCREHGIQIATTTGFYREISELILQRTRWLDKFVASISSSDVREGRPAPYMIFRAMEAAGVRDVRQVMNVGDTPLDLKSGHNAGVRGVVGVLTGRCGEERLRQEPHTQIIASVAELPGLIEGEF